MNTVNVLPWIEIVYPPSQENAWIAEYLRNRLASYRIPGAVAEKTGVRKLSEVKKPCLIVLCTPETPGCPEVEGAVERFKEAGDYHRIIALILSGTPGNRFPYALLQEKLPDGRVVEREPLAANISAPARRAQLKKLETEKLRIIASILGVAFDDLRNRRKRQRMQIAAAAGVFLFAASCAFLLYALSRVRIFSTQNRELNRQYDQARDAEKTAQEQRDSARVAFARNIALQAAEQLENGDSELSLLLCREFLPEMEHVPEVTDTFRNALASLCGKGYVPVTTIAAYSWARYGVKSSDLFSFRIKDSEEGGFTRYISPALPEGYRSGKDYIEEMSFRNGSSLHGCALYWGSFTTAEGEKVGCMRVHFPEKEEQGFFLKDRNGEFLILDGTAFLPDGTMIGIGEDGLAYRIDLHSGEVIPFFNTDATFENDALSAANGKDPGGKHLPHPVTEFRCFDGMDEAFGFSEEAVEVYSLAPFRPADTLAEISLLKEQKGMNYLFGEKKDMVPLTVYSRNPFRYLYTLRTEETEPSGGNSRTDAVILPDGRELLLYRSCFYDLSDGSVRWSFEADDFGGLEQYGVEISSEGVFLLRDREEFVLWDLAEGKEIGRIPSLWSSELYYGPYDEKSGRFSASAVGGLKSTLEYPLYGGRAGNGIIWEYRPEEREVPENMEEQILLAEVFLNGRELTMEEREIYHLD